MPMLLVLNHLLACLLWWVSADTFISDVTSNSLFVRFRGLGTNDIMNVSPDPDPLADGAGGASVLISVFKQYLVSFFWAGHCHLLPLSPQIRSRFVPEARHRHPNAYLEDASR